MGQAAFKHITGMAAGTQTNPTGKMYAELPGAEVAGERTYLQQDIELEGQNGDGKQEHCHLAAWDTVNYILHYCSKLI